MPPAGPLSSSTVMQLPSCHMFALFVQVVFVMHITNLSMIVLSNVLQHVTQVSDTMIHSITHTTETAAATGMNNANM